MAFKETNEVVAAIDAASKAIEQIKADGKFGYDDIFTISPLLEPIKAGAKDAGLVDDEFKAATPEEREEAAIRLFKANYHFASELLGLLKMVSRK